MDDYVQKSVYDETTKRLEEEDKRQNKRLEGLEETVRQINDLTRTVDRLATNMENMLKEQTRQGERLEALESRDGEMWRKVISYIATGAVGIILGYLFNLIGIV